ncbi:hypothetical protein HS7_03940 [Sulfolobales archaeon HS-7]|nr:hypothetical protein HS7_03940 [Sulfolobales archaeon HS-7]
MKVKYYEWIRHGMTEPLLTVNVYKKVEDGKVIATYRIVYYANTTFVIYEDDKYRGGEVVDIIPSSIEGVKKEVLKYYEDGKDDLIVTGEQDYGEKLLDELLEE